MKKKNNIFCSFSYFSIIIVLLCLFYTCTIKAQPNHSGWELILSYYNPTDSLTYKITIEIYEIIRDSNVVALRDIINSEPGREWDLKGYTITKEFNLGMFRETKWPYILKLKKEAEYFVLNGFIEKPPKFVSRHGNTTPIIPIWDLSILCKGKIDDSMISGEWSGEMTKIDIDMSSLDSIPPKPITMKRGETIKIKTENFILKQKNQ